MYLCALAGFLRLNRYRATAVGLYQNTSDPGRLHLVKQNKGRSDGRVTSFLTYEQFSEQSHLTRVMLALNPAARTGDKECVKITFLREEARLNYGVQTAGAIFS